MMSPTLKLKSRYLFSLLIPTVLLLIAAPAEAYRVKFETNLHKGLQTATRGLGKNFERDMGGMNLNALKDVEKSGSTFPPYMIESRTQGERIPRCHVRFVAPAQQQSQHNKDQKPKQHPSQGGNRQQDYNFTRRNDTNTDYYGPPNPDGRRFKKAKVPTQMPGRAWLNRMMRLAGHDHRVSGYRCSLAVAIQAQQALEGKMNDKNNSQANFNKGQNQQRGQAQGAGESFADAFNPAWEAMLQLHMSYLINVANESSGQPCSSRDPVKVHENAVWMIMQMYKRVYLQIALLLLLPGAVLTQVKGLVSSGIMQSHNDDDAVSPFSGILKGMVAIFLIPSTQLIVSYSCDVGNSMSYEIKRHINEQLLYEWADEQVFRAPEGNKKDAIKHPNMFGVLGKLSEGSEKESGVESQSQATVMLSTLVNLSAMSAAFALVMLCAFQITTMSYLMLLGPIAAAFYAWPGGVGSLFNRVFITWVDAVVNVGLWRFWWTTVLLAAQTRIEWLQEIGQYNPYYEWEMIIFVAFIVILSYVPFNPFDFKAGEMVSQIMQKSEMAVSEATQKGGK